MTTPAIRATLPTVEVLSLLLEASADDPPWATRISEQSGLGKSTVSQILARLAALAWVVLREENGPHPGRPPRVLCTLTEEGRHQAQAVLAARRAPHPEKPTASMTRESPSPDDTRCQAQPDPRTTQADAKTIHQQDSRPRMLGHWSINYSSLKTHFAAAAPLQEENRNVPEDDSMVHLIALRKTHEMLRDINRNLTRDFIGRSAVAPAHRMDHEDIMRDILTEAINIRGKAMRAHNY